MSQHGGKREGAGRKAKVTKVNEAVQESLKHMMRQKALLLSAFHQEELINDYVDVVKTMLKSHASTERKEAVRIITDILLRIQPPAEVRNAQTQKLSVVDLVERLKRERELEEDNDEIGSPYMDSDGEDHILTT